MSEHRHSVTSTDPWLEHRVPLPRSQKGKGMTNRRSGGVVKACPDNPPIAAARAPACSLSKDQKRKNRKGFSGEGDGNGDGVSGEMPGDPRHGKVSLHGFTSNFSSPTTKKAQKKLKKIFENLGTVPGENGVSKGPDGTNLDPGGEWTVYRARVKKRTRRILRVTKHAGGNKEIDAKCEELRTIPKNLARVEGWKEYHSVFKSMRKCGSGKSAPEENRYMCLSEPPITGEELEELPSVPRNFDILRITRAVQRTKFDFSLSGCVTDCVRQASPSAYHAFGCPQHIKVPPPEKEINPDEIPKTPELTKCQNSRFLKSRFKKCQKLLAIDRGMTGRPLSHSLECGGLRAALEESYDNLSPSDFLSVKTSQKLEPQPCEFCANRFLAMVEEWKEKRKQKTEVDDNHLSAFTRMFKMNVERGWNLESRSPFIPNGHGSRENTRNQHGNWNEEPFSNEFRTELVFSSGKPRIVTLYSSENTKLLKPLHSALFGHIRRFGWLLVGPPTEEKVATLKGGAYESFDYKSATDNIKTPYVNAAIEILIQKGVNLTCKEKEALRVVSNLTLDSESCGSGQPMGSLMSFPLLCLINKTMVDMALYDTLSKNGKLSKKNMELFVSHRCLINGDDLGLRDPFISGSKRGRFRTWLIHHGRHVGLTVNEEKSMRSEDFFEINSTVFFQGKIQKKTNLGVLRNTSSDTGDFIGIAKDSTVTRPGTQYVLASCYNSFGLQTHKHLRKHHEYIGFIGREPRLRAAAQKQKKFKNTYNPFPVERKPEGYVLSPEDVFNTLEKEVERVRPLVLENPIDRERDEFAYTSKFFEEIVLVDEEIVPPPSKREVFISDPLGSNTMVKYHHEKDFHVKTWSRVLRERHQEPEEHVLKCLVDAWKKKITEEKEENEKKDPGNPSEPDVSAYDTVDIQQGSTEQLKIKKEDVICGEKPSIDISLKPSKIQRLINAIKEARSEIEIQKKPDKSRPADTALQQDFMRFPDDEDFEITLFPLADNNLLSGLERREYISLKGVAPA
uniref:Putative RdRp n=1 Tax=Monilinia ourmiavirus A TaxID=2592715 RepID=A0A7G3W8V8_9VIRU|nr:putative RdRp [Monilinia ourmiavirus A]